MSREQLKFIFCDLLPDLSGKTILDIGSRMGPVLYAVRTPIITHSLTKVHSGDDAGEHVRLKVFVCVHRAG